MELTVFVETMMIYLQFLLHSLLVNCGGHDPAACAAVVAVFELVAVSRSLGFDSDSLTPVSLLLSHGMGVRGSLTQ